MTIAPLHTRATRRWVVVAALAMTRWAAAAGAQISPLMLTKTEIGKRVGGGATAGSSGVTGVRTTVLAGDPTKSGPYTIELRVAPHMKIAAHSHRDDRSGVVVSGVWYFGYGTKADYSHMKTMPPGSFYTEPGSAPHFAMTGDVEAVVYITGIGPTDTKYVDPMDEPKPTKPS